MILVPSAAFRIRYTTAVRITYQQLQVASIPKQHHTMSTMASAGSASKIESSYTKRPRKFAPLNPTGKENGGVKLQGVVFDVDGTMCLPQNYMFREMREVLGIDKSTDILEHITALPSPKQEEAQEAIRAIERQAMSKQTPQPGLEELMSYLDSRNVRKAICTRNFDLPINHLLTTFLPSFTFSPIITRAFKPPKPSPAGILHIAKEWQLQDGGENLIMVGDSIDDVRAGRAAGAMTVLLVNPENRAVAESEETDICIEKLSDLVDLLDNGLECEG